MKKEKTESRRSSSDVIEVKNEDMSQYASSCRFAMRSDVTVNTFASGAFPTQATSAPMFYGYNQEAVADAAQFVTPNMQQFSATSFPSCSFSKDSQFCQPLPATSTSVLEEASEVDHLVRQMHQQPQTASALVDESDLDQVMSEIFTSDVFQTPAQPTFPTHSVAASDSAMPAANSCYATNNVMSYDVSGAQSSFSACSQTGTVTGQFKPSRAMCSTPNNATLNLASTIHHGQEHLLKNQPRRFAADATLSHQQQAPAKHVSEHMCGFQAIHPDNAGLRRRESNASGRSSTGLPPTPPDSQPASPLEDIVAAAVAAAVGDEVMMSGSPLVEANDDSTQEPLAQVQQQQTMGRAYFTEGAGVDEESQDFVLLTPVTRRVRKLHKGCTTIKYNRKNNPDLDKRRQHFCDFPGKSSNMNRYQSLLIYAV